MLTCIFARAYKIVVRKGKFILEVFHSSAEFPLLCLPDSLAIRWMTVARQEASPELLAKYRWLPLHWLPGRRARTWNCVTCRASTAPSRWMHLQERWQMLGVTAEPLLPCPLRRKQIHLRAGMATQDHMQGFRGIPSERKHLSPDAVMFISLR